MGLWINMESNTTVTLLFEDLAVRITCFKMYKIYLKLFDQELFINVKLKFLDILKTKCNSVQERVKNALWPQGLQIEA